MDCRTTYTNKRRRGFTLVELLVATGLGGIVLTVVAHLMVFSGRSMAALSNYRDLDAISDEALKLMSREIREANWVTEISDTFLTLNDSDGNLLYYYYNPYAKTLSRRKGFKTQVLLRECDYLKFAVFQRNPVGGTYDQFPVATPGTTKLVQMTWVCSRRVLGTIVNTESVQSAKFVIRKQ